MKNIDFHAHILPNADHGSDSIETSINQIELSKTANIDIIVATPHFYPHRHKLSVFLEKRAEAYRILKENTNAEIIPGAEVLICDNLDKLEGLSQLCIGNTRSILIELPFSDFRREYVECVENMLISGYKVIIAHADRYKKEDINSLIAIGAKIQLNVSSISSFFVKRHLLDWVDMGYVVALGSDIHMNDKFAYKKFNKTKNRLKNKYEQIMLKAQKNLDL